MKIFFSFLALRPQWKSPRTIISPLKINSFTALSLEILAHLTSELCYDSANSWRRKVKNFPVARLSCTAPRNQRNAQTWPSFSVLTWYIGASFRNIRTRQHPLLRFVVRPDGSRTDPVARQDRRRGMGAVRGHRKAPRRHVPAVSRRDQPPGSPAAPAASSAPRCGRRRPAALPEQSTRAREAQGRARADEKSTAVLWRGANLAPTPPLASLKEPAAVNVTARGRGRSCAYAPSRLTPAPLPPSLGREGGR